jgi:hypothetical protein
MIDLIPQELAKSQHLVCVILRKQKNKMRLIMLLRNLSS